MRPDVNHFLQTRGPVPTGDLAQRLRELPVETAPPYDWEEFRNRSRAVEARKGQRVRWWPHVAAAAGLAGLVAGLAMVGNGGPSDNSLESTPIASAAEEPWSEDIASTTKRNREWRSYALPEGAARRNREWLSRQPVEPTVVRVSSRMAVANLEDRIALFDDALTSGRLQGGASAEQMEVLQQERARLVSSLAQVRYAEALLADGS